MVSMLDRKLLREVRSSAAMLLAVTSIMAVGVMCFIYMRSTYYNLSLAKWRYYNQCRMADFWVDVKKAPLAEVEELINLPGVTAIRPRIQFFATVDLRARARAAQWPGAVAARRAPADHQRHRAGKRRLLYSSAHERSDRQRGLRPPPRHSTRTDDPPDSQQPPPGAARGGHGHQQRIRLPGRPRLDRARPRAFWRLLSEAHLRRRRLRLCRRDQPDRRFVGPGAPGPAAGNFAADGNPAGPLRRANSVCAQNPIVESVPDRRNPRAGPVLDHHADHLPGGGGPGAQRAHGAADRPAARDHRHVQGDRLFRLADLFPLHQVRLGAGPGERPGRTGPGLQHGHVRDFAVPDVLRVSRSRKPRLPRHLRRWPGRRPAVRARRLAARSASRAAIEAGRSDARQAPGARRRHLARTFCLVLESPQLRLAVGAAQRVSPPPAHRRRRVRHLDGRRAAWSPASSWPVPSTT